MSREPLDEGQWKAICAFLAGVVILMFACFWDDLGQPLVDAVADLFR